MASEVDAWFEQTDHECKAELRRLREIILGVDPRMAECIKWQVPTFVFNGNLVSFNRSKRVCSLLFHTGAQIPGEHPILEGETATARTVRFDGQADIEARRPELEAVVRSWIALKGE
jgi:uncharacterized protein YdhG (YjbR/CyaY superfamily)